MDKIIAESGVVITEELLDELRRELRGTGGQPRTPKLTQPFEAHVRKGRLVLDAPTRLPEGEVVELVLLSDVLARGGDWLDDRERARLHRALERGVAQAKAGKTVDADEVIARLRARTKKKATGGHKLKGARVTRARSKGPTKAQLAAMDRIVADSGITITEERLEELWRQHLGA
jgi:hypothetical protein